MRRGVERDGDTVREMEKRGEGTRNILKVI